jgi:uncharacterized protein YqjF (DUF2071 family)
MSAEPDPTASTAAAAGLPPARGAGRPFLTAHWSNLLLLSWPVEPELLANRMPPGCTLDTLDGRAWVSLVAFDFLDTRVLGLPWPGYRDFPEINLRFYVRRDGERGVAFIREFVPLRAVAWIARAAYNEPYAVARMTSAVERVGETIAARHVLQRPGSYGAIRVVADAAPHLPPPDGPDHFFKEHDRGFGTDRKGRCVRYTVEHPPWQVYPVRDAHLDWDWTGAFGEPWAALQKAPPQHLCFAVGSRVAVYRPEVLP